MRTELQPTSRDPVLLSAAAVGLACLALSLVPTATYAEAFAHPSRVARIGGAIPTATMRGAEFFRIALAVGGVAIPLLVWWVGSLCARAAGPKRAAVDAGTLPGMPVTRGDWLALGAIIALGAIVRITLATQSLWYDEISALLSFALEGPGVAFGSYAVPTNHVPMTLSVWLSVTLLGSVGELAVRLPAIIAGIATIPAAFALGRVLRDERLGKTLAFIAAIAPIAVLESVEARGYAFVILGATVAALALARAARTGARREYLVFALATAFAAWAHPVAILLPFAAGLVGLVRDRRLAAAALIAGILAAVLLSPLLGDVLATRQDYVRTDAAQPSVFSREGYEALTGLTLSWSRWFATAAPFLSALAIVGITMVIRARDEATTRARRVLFPFALALALALVLPPILGAWTYARFTLFALPIGLVAVAFALEGAARRTGRAPVRAILIGAIALDALLSLGFYRVKQPIRDAVEIVAAQRAERDQVATIGLPDNAVAFYARQFGFDAAPTGFLGKDLAAVVERTRPEFVVVLYPDRLAPETFATLDAGFDRTHRLEGWADWGHGDVEIWRRPRVTR
jgi:hypothetical protein